MNWRIEVFVQISQIRDMLSTPSNDNLNKIVILNPKGGCGKSTLVTNLAAVYAQHGTTPAIMDYDPQGSTMATLAALLRNLNFVQAGLRSESAARAADGSAGAAVNA